MGDGLIHQPLRPTETIGHTDSPRNRDRLQALGATCDSSLFGRGDSIVFTLTSPLWQNVDFLRASRRVAHLVWRKFEEHREIIDCGDARLRNSRIA